MNKFIHKLVSRTIRTKGSATYCIKLLIKFDLFMSKLKSRFQPRTGFYWDLEKQFA